MKAELKPSEKKEIENAIDNCLQPIIKRGQEIFDRMRNDYCHQNQIGIERIPNDLLFIMKFNSLEFAKMYYELENHKKDVSCAVYGNTMDRS